jgi:dTDP-4-dehydrorhamnose reductase
MHGSLSSVPGIAEKLRLLADEPEVPDVLGVDHYITSDRYLDHRLDQYPEGIVPRSEEHGFVDVELARVAGFEVDGFWRSIRETWDRYHLPVALTEVHLGGEPSDEVLWWAEAWDDATNAVRSGIPVEGVASWAAFGSCDWDTLMCSRSGSYRPGCFDVSGGRPVLTPLGKAIQATAAGRPPTPRVSAWWRQPHRVTYPGDPTMAA